MPGQRQFGQQGQFAQPGAQQRQGGEVRENRDNLYVAAALLTLATEVRMGSMGGSGAVVPPDPNLSNPNDVPLTTEVDQLFKVWYIFLLSTLTDTTNSWPSPPETAAPPATTVPASGGSGTTTVPASGGTTSTTSPTPVSTPGVPTGSLAGVLSPAVANILNGIL